MRLKMSPTPGQPELTSAAKIALGKITPELAWEQIKTLAQKAIEDQHKESLAAATEQNLPIDLRNLSEVLGVTSPNKGINEFQYANPGINLKNLPQQTPLKILKALIKMLVSSDRWQAPKQAMQG